MEILQEKEIRVYELTFLVPPTYTKSELEAILESVEKAVVKKGGEVKNKDEWGKKELAYSIKKEGKAYDEAIYYHWKLEMEPEQANELKKELNLIDEVIRYLVVARE